MALATVKHLERLPASAIPAGITARLRLIASTTGDDHGFVTGAYTAIGGDRIQHPDSTGLFTFANVNPNTGTSDDVVDAPAGTRYGLSIWQNVGGKNRRIGSELVLLVADTTDVQYTTDILSELPGALADPASTVALAGETAARQAADLLRIPYTEVTVGREGLPLVADPSTETGVRVRYPAAKGPNAIAVGTSIERGTGGSSDIIGTFVDGRPSDADWLLHACARSGRRLRYRRQAGVGGDFIGGTGVVLADAESGSPTLDIGFGANGLGPALPYQGQTFFFADWHFSQGSVGANNEACYVNAEPVAITGGERVTLLTATTRAHVAGEIIRWGIIGRFQYDVADHDPDIVFIGGATNDREKLTAAQIVAGTQTICELTHATDAIPVVCTICAAPTLQDETDEANAGLRAMAAEHGHWLLDFWRVTVDPATRGMTDAISKDTVHPNIQGAMNVLAREVHRGFLDHVEIRRGARTGPGCDGYGQNMVPNGTFSGGTTGAGGTLTPVGTDVQEFFSNGAILNTVVPPRLGDRVNGNLLRITAAGGKGTHGSKITSFSLVESGLYPGAAAGDQVCIEAFLRLEGFKADGFAKANVRLVCTGTVGASSLGLIWEWPHDFPGGIVTSEAVTIPTTIGTLTNLSLQAYIACPPLAGADVGYGVLEIGEWALFNITRGDF